MRTIVVDMERKRLGEESRRIRKEREQANDRAQEEATIREVLQLMRHQQAQIDQLKNELVASDQQLAQSIAEQARGIDRLNESLRQNLEHTLHGRMIAHTKKLMDKGRREKPSDHK